MTGDPPAHAATILEHAGEELSRADVKAGILLTVNGVGVGAVLNKLADLDITDLEAADERARIASKGRSTGCIGARAPPNYCPACSKAGPAARSSSPTARHQLESPPSIFVPQLAAPACPTSAPANSSSAPPGLWPTQASTKQSCAHRPAQSRALGV